MMKIEFKTSGASFEDVEYEVKKILETIIEKVESGRAGGYIMDTNGNNIGEWELD